MDKPEFAADNPYTNHKNLATFDDEQYQVSMTPEKIGNRVLNVNTSEINNNRKINLSLRQHQDLSGHRSQTYVEQ